MNAQIMPLRERNSQDDDSIWSLFSEVDRVLPEHKRLDSLVDALMPVISNAAGCEVSMAWTTKSRGNWTCTSAFQISPNSVHDASKYSQDIKINVTEVAELAAPDIFIPNEFDADDEEATIVQSQLRSLVLEHRQLVIPICINDETACVLVLFQPMHSESMLHELSDLIALQQRLERGIDRVVLAGHAVKAQQTQTRELVAKQQRVLKSVDIIGRSLNVQKVAHDVVNELYAHLGEGRVSLSIYRGKTCKLHAISNQQWFDKRSADVIAIQKLASVVGRTGVPVWHPAGADQLPSRINKLFAKYYEDTDGQSIALIPLLSKKNPSTDPNDLKGVVLDRKSTRGKVVGVLAIEGLTRQISQQEIESTWSQFEPSVTNAVSNSRHYSGLFLMPLWRGMGRVLDLFRGHHRNKAILATSLIVLISLVLAFVQSDLRLRSKGVIQPVERARIYAKVDGVIGEMHFKDGEWVNQGQLLMQMKNPKLDAEIAEVEGDLREAEEELTTLRLQRLADDFPDQREREKNVKETAGLQASIHTLRERYELLMEKRSHLSITSPVNGQVVSWDLPRRLFQRPIERGQRILSVANTKGDWELELKMPDTRSGYLTGDAQETSKATFVFASHPTQVFDGKVRQVAQSANVDAEDGNVVRVYVDLNKSPDELGIETRPGTEVIAHVHAGRASLAYCKSYELLDWIRRVAFTYF